ncbi:unnamed protein product [Prorocentrum cordatum]|uniref:Uncharacterized protein n=1 Tax=Prorocentrum cordatum TaxID=2364126 RepID=A0ABN9V1B8_9DINO|nr:unnamed protein product [Polarella glacialis]
MLRAVEASRALLVLLSQGTLAAPEQITAIEQIVLSIEKAENAGLPPPSAISMSLPGFQFPADEFYSEKVPKLLAEKDVLPQVQEASQGQVPGTRIRSFFQQGAVQFSVGASERTI